MYRRSRIPRRKKAYHVGIRSESISSISRFQKTALTRPSKKQQPYLFKIGDVVTFVYNGKRVHGIAKYIGNTEFSANTLCGVVLLNDTGKHNGTVKGRKYFECSDKQGVFVPLRKVTLASSILRDKISKQLERKGELDNNQGNSVDEKEVENEDKEKDSDMRITVRSYKAPQKLSTTSINPPNPGTTSKEQLLSVSNDRSTTTSNSSCDSGFESPTRLVAREKLKSRRSKAPKNIVVSSFIAESPQKPVIFNSFDEEESSHSHTGIKSHHQLREKPPNKLNTNNIKTPPVESLDPDVFESEVKSNQTSEHIEKEKVSEEPCVQNVITNNVEATPEISEDDIEDGKSKIPRRIAIATKIFEKSDDDKPKTKTSLNIRTKSTQIKKASVTANISKLRQPAVTSKATPTASLRKTSVESPKTPSTVRQSSSKISTSFVRKPIQSGKADSPKKGAKDDDSSVVMGNSNATIHPSAKNLDPNVSEMYSQCEVSGAVVIERSKKSKTKSNLNGIVSNVSSNELAKVKDLEKQLDNLNNQLKERTNRIDELELVLKNNNNNIEEEKNEFNKLQSDLKNELAQKNESIQLQEKQLKVAEELVQKSNKGLEALAMVIKYYVTQLEQTSSALKSSRSENSNISNKVKELDIKQLELQSTITKLTENLESESCRCEALQKDFEALKLNHQAEISRLNEEHIIERNKAVTQKQKEYDEKFQEVLDKQTKDAENHRNEINRLKDEHEKAIQELKNEKEKEARFSVESPRVTSPGGTPIYADRYNNMPEELKSLNIVLDMKNEELKNLRSKTNDLERKIEKHQELQTKYDALLQKHQSMQEMLKMKSHNEQQLSVERENLLEKFDKESKKVSQLSMEKEQLIWRASNPDLSYRSLSRCDEDDECDEDEERDSPPSPLRSGSFSANSTPRRPKVNGEAEIAKKLKRRSMNF